MEKAEIERRYQNICADVYEGRIKSALDTLNTLLHNINRSDYFFSLENITENYRSLLNYAFDGVADPQRKEILQKISVSVLNLADEVRDTLTSKEYPQRSLERVMIGGTGPNDPQVMADFMEEYLSEKNIHKLLKEAGNTTNENRTIEKIFRLIWLNQNLKDTSTEKIRQIAHSDLIEIPEKCLIVSSLTLSILDFFDPSKVLMLMEFVTGHETQVYERALTGLVFVLIWYDRRISFYPEILSGLDEFSQDEGIHQDTEALLLQLLMAQETESIVKAFEEEVLPEMRKMMPKFEDRFQFENILEDEDLEGKNPDWKEMIDEVPGLFERIEKFSKMQMEGGDVFLSTFSQLKRFDFFTRMSNWFVPFYADNPDLKKTETDEEKFFSRLLEGLGSAFYICNSDKYSFALNFNAVPAQQRSLIMTYFEAELEQMKEMASEEEILSPSATSHSIFIQYIQDLYRFFKLYPAHAEFRDVFQKKIRFTGLYFYKTFFERDNFTARLAVFYFEKEHYLEAIEMNKYLVQKEGPKGEYFEKIGYCYQKLKKYHEAVDFYKKAELFDSDRIWILRKLGLCSLKTHDYSGALGYFEECARLQPDDLKIRAQIGQCYMNLNNFEEALNNYAKVLYFQQDNLKVLRPIAYCQFVLGKLDAAEESYSRILSEAASASPFDLMNAAHVKLCLNNRMKALELYHKSKTGVLSTDMAFKDAFEEDIPNLLQNGITRDDLPLLMDYLLFHLD